MSKSLTKSRPLWDMTMEVKASSVLGWRWDWDCVGLGMKREAMPMRMYRMVVGAIVFFIFEIETQRCQNCCGFGFLWVERKTSNSRHLFLCVVQVSNSF